MRVTITRTVPVLRDPRDHGMFIQWDVHDAPSAEITFKLERAGAPEGPFDFVIEGLKGFHFFDKFRDVPAPPAGATRENLNYLSITRSYYYRVTATAGNGDVAQHVIDLQNTLSPRRARLQRKMLRDLSIGFKFNGTDTYVLKRKHWGLRCRKCFDVLTKKVTNSKCLVCYGVGIEGGFENPVLIRGRFCAPNSNTDLTPQGLSDVTKVRFLCSDYPNVDPLDILVDKKQNQRFIVQQQAQTELQRNTVHQSLVVSQLAQDSIEYRIPVNTDTAPVIY